ncbi:hypothetical protein BV898_18832 [Hypsibius exemplaris]|uniref:Uncharacterized protein n=1 Tax=Hypsibius exemplaris TaxID=2072580 RepID=A0A9X6NKM9_HYPEX|nr:hypothetical protein BV898_18832 [Hypsibius exemplaris]
MQIPDDASTTAITTHGHKPVEFTASHNSQLIPTIPDEPLTGLVKRRRTSHLLRRANLRDLCVNCRTNSFYLNRLVLVFEIINIIATVTGFGALLGYVHLNWTHGTLLAMLFWLFSIGLGTALMDEYTTKPTARFATANFFAGMMLFSIVFTVVPLVFLIVGLHMEQTAPEFINPVPANISHLRNCTTTQLYEEAKLNKTVLMDGCNYTSTSLIPSFQFVRNLKWPTYAITLGGMICGLVVWCYGLFCYFSRLRCMKIIFNKGGILECIPCEFKSNYTFLHHGHLEDEGLELQLMAYFSNLERRQKQSLEEFLDEAMHSPPSEQQPFLAPIPEMTDFTFQV